MKKKTFFLVLVGLIGWQRTWTLSNSKYMVNSCWSIEEFNFFCLLLIFHCYLLLFFLGLNSIKICFNIDENKVHQYILKKQEKDIEPNRIVPTCLISLIK